MKIKVTSVLLAQFCSVCSATPVREITLRLPAVRPPVACEPDEPGKHSLTISLIDDGEWQDWPPDEGIGV